MKTCSYVAAIIVGMLCVPSAIPVGWATDKQFDIVRWDGTNEQGTAISFRKEKKSWNEYHGSRLAASFVESKRTVSFVELYDASRKLWLRLSPDNVTWTQDGNWNSLPFKANAGTRGPGLVGAADGVGVRSETDCIKRGNSLFDQSEYGNAIEAYSEAIRLNPRSFMGFTGRAKAWAGNGNLAAATKDYAEAIRINPDDVRPYLYRGNGMVKDNQLVNAIQDFSRVIQLSPTWAGGYELRGFVWSQRGELGNAIADYSSAIRLAPAVAGYYVSRGNALDDNGDSDRAIADYDEAIRLKPTLAAAYRDRAIAWNFSGRYDKAVADYHEAIQLDPTDWVALNKLAWLLATCPDANYRDGKRAVVLATKSVESPKSPIWALGVLAAAYAEVCEFDKAVAWQRTAIGASLANDESVAEGQYRLSLYLQNKPVREYPIPVGYKKRLRLATISNVPVAIDQ